MVMEEQEAQERSGDEWTRTTDSRIFSPMLYQLSYSTAEVGAKLNNFGIATKILINNF